MLQPLDLVNDFLYVSDSNGEWWSLFKGKITSEAYSVFQGSQWDSEMNQIIWGEVRNPSSFPNKVPYNPIKSYIKHKLTFENEVPAEWWEPDFYLLVNGLRFTLTSSYRNHDSGNAYAEAEADNGYYV